uniref:pyridoxal 5'-phosphate synthase n=1 Tax=Riptortus pedestris TaxID=329032 RepID=R4WJB8_RIPPE|nr:pyridoxamine 5'-phosphate oxidase [Riptortus pedestris]
MSTFDIRDMRVKYKDRTEAFTEDQLVSDEPIGQFTAWFEEMKKCPDIIEPNAMCLATANRNGIPSARMVLLKGYGPEGFKFFTNYESRKGCDLAENPQASLMFYWPPFNRQVRIEGKVEKVPDSESVEYFNKRPISSRVSAIISEQSKLVPSRDYLIKAANDVISRGEVERPPFWGGFVLHHEYVEFWQGQSDRLHDRIIYKKNDVKWDILRLAP